MPRSIKLAPALSTAELGFVQEFMLDRDPGAAASRAGLPRDRGRELLCKVSIKAALQALSLSRSARTSIYSDEVLRRWWLLATADARELVQLRRVCCRHCYGFDHQYQFTADELRREQRNHELNQRELPEPKRRPFDDLGGDGYDGTKPPVAGCTECFGEGVLSVYLADSRSYSPAAALLFDGVKVTAQGSIEVKMRDRQHALDQVAEHLGMLVKRNVNLDLDPAKLTDEQLDEALRQFGHLAEGEARQLIEHTSSGEGETIDGDQGDEPGVG